MMRFLLPVFLFSLAAYAGDTAGTYRLSGTMYTTHTSSGGAYRVDEPRREPAAFVMLYVVRWTGEHQLPVVVDSMLTDETGRFGLKLPPGKYGILAVSDLKKPSPGQWLPRGRDNGSSDRQTIDWWEMSTGGPVDLSLGNATGIELIHHYKTICYTCP